MDCKSAIAILALSLGGCLAFTSTPVAAQQGQQQGEQQHQKNVQRGNPSRGGGNAGAVRGGGRNAIAPRGNSRTVTPRVNTQRKFRMTTPNTVTQRKFGTATPRNVIRKGTPKLIAPSGGNTRFVTSTKLRGAGNTSIRGRNFSVRRSGHRVRHNNGWRTFVAISALSAIVIGSSDYYPYAYISASQPYCSGYTRDNCELRWQAVDTIEGDTVYQCVAYCPWR